MKLINRVDFAYIFKYYTQNGPEGPTNENENVMSAGCLSGWLPYGWLPSGRLPIWLFACGSACAMCWIC